MAKRCIDRNNPSVGCERPAPFKLGLLALVLVVTLSGPIDAQQDPCLNRTIAVNVRSEDGHLVGGLSAQNFRGKVHGHAVRTVSIDRDSGPRRIVMVLDASGSMHDVWKLETSAAEGLLGADQDSSFALITFADRVEHRIDFTQGRKKLSDELAGLETPIKDIPKGRTALRDALAGALDLLRPVQFGDAIVLVSDGGENASKLKDSPLRDALVSSGVRLFALITGEDIVNSRGRTSEEFEGPEWIRGLVAATGGDSTSFHVGIDSLSKFPPKSHAPIHLLKKGQQVMSFATVGFANEITEFYRLAIKLPEPLDKPRELQLDVLDANGKRNSHWLVVYPHRLAACP